MGQQSVSARPAWVGSRIGMSDQVLAPWSPLIVKGGQAGQGAARGGPVSIACWGRAYEFSEEPGLNHVQTAGKAVLTGPIRLVARVDGRVVQWARAYPHVLEQTPARVRLSQTTSDESLAVSAEIQVEYDGVIRFDCKLQPRREVRLEELTIEIPLRAEHAKYLYHFPGDWAKKVVNAGFLPPRGYVAAFRPFIWLGDEERGLAWFCESDQNWIATNADRVTEIVRSGDQVILRLHLVSKPLDLTPVSDPQRLAYTFGLQATPVKPVTKDVWDYRIFHIDVNLSKYGIDTRLRVPDTILDQLASSGVKTLAFHEHWTDIESYVTTPYGDDLKKLVTACHDRGMQLILYFGFLISDLTPEWPEVGEECVVMPRGGYEPYDCPPQPKQNAYRVCYKSVWQNRVAAGIAAVMDEYDIDGVYLDGTEYVWPCANHRHGCGYTRPDGSAAPTYPFWAVRTMMQRIYSIVKSRKPDGQINVHNSTCMTIPTLGWATSYWDGEQFRDLPPGSATTEVLSLDAFRTEFMGQQWGVPAEFLSYEEENKTAFAYHQAYAFTLLHDVLTRSYSIGPGLKLNSALWRLSDEFGRKQAEWLPYWRNAESVTVQPQGVYVSLYRHPERGVLAVISNLGREEAIATVQLHWRTLGIGPDLSARDALTGESVVIRQGRVTLPLKSLGWKIIWAESEP